MDSFRRFAYAAVACDVSFAGVAAAILLVTFRSYPPLALLLAANVALGICVVLGLRVSRLTADNVTRTELWQALERDERLLGDESRHIACEILGHALLRFARAAALAAIVLSASSLILSLAMQSTSQVVAAGGIHAMHASTIR
jgi:hypothetical protein